MNDFYPINFTPPNYDPSYGLSLTNEVVAQELASTAAADPASSMSTYADLSYAQTQIQAVITAVAALISSLNASLAEVAVSIDQTDQALVSAVNATWPKDLGAPPIFISFSYYNYLITLNSAAASYVINAYEEGVSDVDGNNAIDLLPLAKIIQTEANNINDFLTTNITSLNDSSEQRSVEGFQDWASAALVQIQNIQTVFSTTPGQLQSNEAEVEALTNSDAANIQALLKSTLNSFNAQVTQDTQNLQTNFGNYSGSFYQDSFQPALNFRQNVTSQVLPIYSGALADQINASSLAADQDMNSVLTQQLSRTTYFAAQMTTTLQNIQLRDYYRNTINQISAVNSSAVAYSGNVTTNSESQAAVTYFTNVINNPNTITSSLATSSSGSAAIDPSSGLPLYSLNVGASTESAYTPVSDVTDGSGNTLYTYSGDSINQPATGGDSNYSLYTGTTSTSTSPTYEPDHSQLTGLANPLAHSQYLLKAGDTITGPIAMESGTTIGGIIPSTHAHTGTDGSALIQGSNIQANTLEESSINTSSAPDVPTGLEVIDATLITPPSGVAYVTLILSWTGDSNQYEIQFTEL